MSSNKITYDELIAHVEELKTQVNEAHEIIDAIRRGEVDAFIVKNDGREELYTLTTADKTYRLFIEKMNEGAVTISKEGFVLYCNSSFARLVNEPIEKIIGHTLEELLPKEHRNTVMQLEKTAWAGQEKRAEIDLPGPNGTPVPVILSMNTLEIDGGTALSIIVTDISLQKETQEQKKAMEKKDEFITIASHELKTPVTSIKGYIQILRHSFSEEGNTTAADVLGKVDTQINKLTTLISDLLDVKKIENGQLQYHIADFDFNELVNEVIEETARVLNRHNIRAGLSGNCHVHGDRNKIGQVVTNFIDNASKYSAAGTDIIVSTVKKEGRIRLSVQDFGIGIPKEQQSRVFERFFRVSGKKENTYSGLGLGLYISAEIITRHRGIIGIESDEGRGSTFYFELPCNQ